MNSLIGSSTHESNFSTYCWSNEQSALYQRLEIVNNKTCFRDRDHALGFSFSSKISPSFFGIWLVFLPAQTSHIRRCPNNWFQFCSVMYHLFLDIRFPRFLNLISNSKVTGTGPWASWGDRVPCLSMSWRNAGHLWPVFGVFDRHRWQCRWKKKSSSQRQLVEIF